jgi:3-oxocholest-4-en-26-oate---CoA ligase
LGQCVVAIVAPTAGHTPTLESLRDTCRHELAGYKLPRAVIVVQRVVRNEVGKVDYAWVQSVLAAEDGDA